MRLVLDTNVVVSGLLWHGPPREIMRVAFRGDVLIFTSVPLLVEVAKTLGEPKFEKEIAASTLTVNQLIETYVSAAGLSCQPMFHAWFPMLMMTW